MKKVIILALVLGLAGMGEYIFAAESTTQATVTAAVGSSFNIAFYPRTEDANDFDIVFPSGQITFPAIAGTEEIVYPDGRGVDDGKADIGLLFLSNSSESWGMKMSLSGDIPADNIIAYTKNKVYDRNDNNAELDGMQLDEGWHKIEDVTVYKAVEGDLVTLPKGTVMLLSFAIIPSGKFTYQEAEICNGDALPAKSYTSTVLFTMATGL